MDYISFYIINYSILAVFTLIISKVIYSFLKKKTKLSSFYCFLLTIIPILILYFSFKIYIKTTIELLSALVILFIYSLLGLLSGQYSFSAISILLFIIIAMLLSIVGLFLILKFYDKNSFKKNKILKIFTIFSTIILSLFIICLFYYLSIIGINAFVDAMFSNIEF